MNEIKIPVPDNYDLEEFTVTYRRSHNGLKAVGSDIKILPKQEQKLLGEGQAGEQGQARKCPVCRRNFVPGHPDHLLCSDRCVRMAAARDRGKFNCGCGRGFYSARSLGQHQRKCLERKGKKKAERQAGKTTGTMVLVDGCPTEPANIEPQAVTSTTSTAASSEAGAPRENAAAKPSPDFGRTKMIEDAKKRGGLRSFISTVFRGVEQKTMLPDDFNPQQKLEAGAYVWHDLWKLGKIIEIGEETGTVDFKGAERYFSLEGLRIMLSNLMKKVAR